MTPDHIIHDFSHRTQAERRQPLAGREGHANGLVVGIQGLKKVRARFHVPNIGPENEPCKDAEIAS